MHETRFDCVVDAELLDLVGSGCGKIFGIRFERDRILQNAQCFYNCWFAVNYGTDFLQEIIPG
jgi:hypothetical protein